MPASERVGKTSLPLALLPGTLCDARVFGAMVRELADHADMAAHPFINVAMTGLDTARALAERALSQIPGRFIPVGFSLGAIVALEMAVMAPERIAGMVLIAANGRDVPEADHAARRSVAATDPAGLVGEILWDRSIAAQARDDATLRAAIVAMAETQPHGTLALQTEVALTRTDKRPLLHAMPMPVLVLGGAEDRIAPPDLQRELADGLPNAELIIAPDAGHFLPLECPDLCAHTLVDWLARVRTVA